MGHLIICVDLLSQITVCSNPTFDFNVSQNPKTYYFHESSLFLQATIVIYMHTRLILANKWHKTSNIQVNYVYIQYSSNKKH